MEEQVPGSQPLPEEQAAQEIYNYAANGLIQQQRTAYEVTEDLVAKGLSRENAELVVHHIEEQADKARKAKAKKDMLYGGLWCAGGTVVTVASMNAASGGGSYVITWGAILFGGMQFVRGLVNYT